MIDKDYDSYQLICDICGEVVKEFDDFYDAVDYKKDNGWRSRRVIGGWEDVCPECQKEG